MISRKIAKNKVKYSCYDASLTKKLIQCAITFFVRIHINLNRQFTRVHVNF